MGVGVVQESEVGGGVGGVGGWQLSTFMYVVSKTIQ